jgi:hypothetical protein
MTRIILTTAIITTFISISAYSQIVADTFYIPNYPIPAIYYTDEAPELPDNVWNHKLKYFPDSIIHQIGPTCGQTSGVFNCMTYMFNRAYDREADLSNTFPPNYTYSLHPLHYGMSAFDSWNVAKSQGHPSRLEHEKISFVSDVHDPNFNDLNFLKYWMNGYENYYKSFFNRVGNYYSLNVRNDSDLRLLQHFFHDSFEINSKWWCCNIYANPIPFAYAPFRINVLELYNGHNHTNGFCMVHDTLFHQDLPTHCMTITGFYKNDSIDFNGDGLITDTIDINGDAIVNFHDNETTLWIVQNGAIILLKYDAICQIWNQQVFFPIPDTVYSPELTFKIKIKHPKRGNIKISAGFSSDLNSSKPEVLIDFPVFNFHGGPFCMTGEIR